MSTYVVAFIMGAIAGGGAAFVALVLHGLRDAEKLCSRSGHKWEPYRDDVLICRRCLTKWRTK